MKRLLSLVLALCMIFALCACASTTEEAAEEVEEVAEEAVEEAEEAAEEAVEEIKEDAGEGKALKIGYSTVAYSIALLPQYMIDTFAEMAGEEGWTVDIMAAEGDAEKQGEQFSTLVSKGYDYIVMLPADPVMAIDWCAEAAEAGIPVICMHVDVDEAAHGEEGGCYAYCGNDNADIANKIYDYMVENNPDGANIVEIGGVPVQADYIVRTETFNGNLDGETYKQLGDVQWAYSSRADAQGFMETFISTYGDDIDVFVGYDDDLTLGGVNALQNAGMTDVQTYSITGQIDAMQAVKDGTLTMTVFTPTKSMCENCINVIKALEAGESVDYYQYIETVCVDASNVDQYADQAEF